MVIDMASVFAERYKDNPQMLQSAVLGQGGDPSLDAYTALRALQLLKESQRMQAAMAAQGPTQSPSLVDQALQPEMPPQIMAAQPQPQPQPQPQGLAGMPSNMPEEEQGFAPGGIVSFQSRGLVEGDDEGGGDDNPLLAALENLQSSPGDPVTYQQLSSLYPGLIKQIMKDAPKGMSAKERADFVKDYIAERKAEVGESPYAAMRQEIATARGERDKNLEQAKGLALLRASEAALRPGGTMRGLAAAASEFGGAYGQALQADRAERRALANMELNLTDAERKERMGMFSEARAAATAADKDRIEASRAHGVKMTTLANLVSKGMQATKPQRPAGSGRPPAPPKLNERLADAEEAFENNPTEENARRVTALRRAVTQTKTSEFGPTRATVGMAGPLVRAETEISDALDNWKVSPAAKAYRKALKEDPAEAARLEAEELKRIKARFTVSTSGAGGPGGAALPAAPAAAARAADPLGIR